VAGAAVRWGVWRGTGRHGGLPVHTPLRMAGWRSNPPRRAPVSAISLRAC